MFFNNNMLPSNNSSTNHTYLIHMYQQDLALNNLQGLVCYKTQPTNQLTILSFTL